jgi:hypothetical protein
MNLRLNHQVFSDQNNKTQPEHQSLPLLLMNKVNSFCTRKSSTTLQSMPALKAINHSDNNTEYDQLANNKHSNDSGPYLWYPLLTAIPTISASA